MIALKVKEEFSDQFEILLKFPSTYTIDEIINSVLKNIQSLDFSPPDIEQAIDNLYHNLDFWYIYGSKIVPSGVVNLEFCLSNIDDDKPI